MSIDKELKEGLPGTRNTQRMPERRQLLLLIEEEIKPHRVFAEDGEYPHTADSSDLLDYLHFVRALK